MGKSDTGQVMLGEVGSAVDAYMGTARKLVADQLAAVYLVGGVALGDFSDRQSNIDLVLVGEPAFSEKQRQDLVRAAGKPLRRAGRPPAVWVASWDEIADGASARPEGSAVPELDTPLTRVLLRNDAVAVDGPDWPVVALEEGDFQAWCRLRLQALVAEAEQMMLMRRDVTSLVLEAARLTQGVRTGRVFSKTEGGQSVGSLVPPHFRRILNDAVGYRGGATTSMYWGPFERKYDARVLLGHLVDAAES